MKKIIILFIALTLLISGKSIAKEFEVKKFKVEYTIVFNAITLEEASRLEDIIKEKFKDACNIDIVVEDADTLSFTSGSASGLGAVIYFDDKIN